MTQKYMSAKHSAKALTLAGNSSPSIKIGIDCIPELKKITNPMREMTGMQEKEEVSTFVRVLTKK
jgi:hypothetical protein